MHFAKGQNIKTYGGPEPRFTIRYLLNDQTSLKASVSRNLQYIHLVSNAGTTLPTDLWVPSTYIVQPQKSWLYAAGLFKNFKNNMFEASVELYYKANAKPDRIYSRDIRLHSEIRKIHLFLERAGVTERNDISINRKADGPDGSDILYHGPGDNFPHSITEKNILRNMTAATIFLL